MTDVQKQAYEDYINGMKYAEIAVKYSLPLSTVKTWANRYFKKKMVSNETFETAETETMEPHKRGGANNLKHGAYARLYWDALDEDERELLDDAKQPPDVALEHTLATYILRERRLLKLVAKIKADSDGYAKPILRSIKKDKSDRADGENKTVTEAATALDYLKIFEAELTKIQSAKTKCASELARLQKEAEEKNNGKTEQIDKITIDLRRR